MFLPCFFFVDLNIIDNFDFVKDKLIDLRWKEMVHRHFRIKIKLNFYVYWRRFIRVKQCNFQFAFTYHYDFGFLSLVVIITKYLRNRLEINDIIRITLSDFKTNQTNNKYHTEFYINQKLKTLLVCILTWLFATI